MSRSLFRVWMVLVAGLLAASAVFAQALKAIPPLSARVIDTTGTLQGAEKSQIEAKLQAFEQSRGTQIVVLMVPTTLPEDIVDYTQRVGDLWKIGRREVGDGLLLVIAKNDRTLRIAPAKTLEGAVPDLAARRVIDTAITPRFKQGDFAGGISAGLDQLMALISGERLPEPPRATAGSGAEAADWQGLMVFLFVAVPVAARLLSLVTGRKLGSLLTGGAVGALAWWLSASLLLGLLAMLVGAVFALATTGARSSGWGRGGGWGGPGWGGGAGGGQWGGGGGFRSGGGGNFGGGGASGRW